MPRKQNIKRKKTAFQNAKEEEEEEEEKKCICPFVPDSNLDSLKEWIETSERILEKESSAETSSADPLQEHCVKDIDTLAVDVNLSNTLEEKSQCELIHCSREDLGDEKSQNNYEVQEQCLNLSTCASETAQNYSVTDSEYLSAKNDIFAQSENKDYDLEIIPQAKTSTDSGAVIYLSPTEDVTKAESSPQEVKIKESIVPLTDSDVADSAAERLHEESLLESESYFTKFESEAQVLHDHDEAADSNFENKPYDLSLKSDFKNGLDLTVAQTLSEPEVSEAADDTLCSYNEDEQDESEAQKEGGEEKSDPKNEVTEITPQQQLLLTHLSKIQQNFVSNLLQYQARFLAHYQQFQQQMMSEANSGSDGSGSPQHEGKSEDKADEDASDSEETTKPSTVIPPPLIPAAHLLSNLVPYALYHSLLPNVSGSPMSSFANPLLSSLASLSSQQAAEEGNEERSDADESDPPSATETSSSPFQQLAMKSSEMAQTHSTDSTSIQKYSILNSLIGSSKQTSFTAAAKNAENSDENETGNSSFQFKRKRIAFSAKQYELLQTTFEHNNFPEPGDQQCIARQLKAPYRSIKMWFQNKRANARKKLFPGEKGSGRTVTGEKIPGDTDTRFYCDKCPSAFICQKYLNNHLDAHKLYTKSCPQCRVVFTHECLLNTHTISKCGSKEEKHSRKEAGKSESKSHGVEGRTAENETERDLDDEVTEGECKSQRMNGFHGNLNASSDAQENGPGISSSILAHLNSPLPLLTLLQIQKTQAEQKESENQNAPEQEQDQESSEQMNMDSSKQNTSQLKANESDSSSNDCPESDSPGVHYSKIESSPLKRKIPPLIPSELVKPLVNNAARFAILRQLLTNYQYQRASESEADYQDDSVVLNGKSDNSKQSSYRISDRIEAEDTNDVDAEFKPRNIPEHLYQLLDNKNGIHRHANHDDASVKSENLSGNEDFTNEAEPLDTEVITMVRNKDEAECIDEKRKMNALYEEKDAKLQSRLSRGPKPKRLRRRTTVFTENQHRVLYLHFTHCNFPDPSMFRILSKLTGLTPHVIKIWFQNERSRQRRQVLNSEGEVTREKKPYKCRDCGVEFAMPAFLVKHCMRHIPTDNVTSQARKCPICMVEFETQKLHSHFMASHNLSIMLEDEGNNEENICHLCKEHFTDLSSLSIHKNEHLKDTKYGDPPQCIECKTTFVNVLCLEAHMATHYKFKWDHSCLKCKMKFYDKILLESHLMSHCLNNNTKHSSVITEETPLNNHHQSQYFISLLQQVSDSQNKPLKPKHEDSDTSLSLHQESDTGIADDEKEEITILTKISTGDVDHPAEGKPVTNLSFKFIPVKFIPVTSSPSQPPPLKDARSVVTVISPTFIKSEDDHIVSNHPAKRDISDTVTVKSESYEEIHCDRVSGLNISGSHNPNKKKKVPNLIPISDSGIPLNVGEKEVSLLTPPLPKETVSDSNTERGSSSENDLKENEESLCLPFQAVENSDSQVLVYTPYASEYRKRRRTPTHFNSSQRDILEAYYKYDNFPDPSEQLHLSEYLRVPYSVIKTWFQNTRKNHRKHLKESLNFEVGGPFECMDCRVCFVSKIYLDTHVRQHSETQPFVCQLCHRQFPHQAVHDIHRKMGCSKKCKKKHEQIRQFSSLTRTFKLSEKEELDAEGQETISKKEKHTRYPETPRRKRKLSKDSEESNVKYFRFEFQEEGMAERSELSPRRGVTPSNSSEVHNQETEMDRGQRSGDNPTDRLLNSELNNDLCCVSCNARFDFPALLNDHHCPKFMPQLVGYKCPECNKTFQSFLSIAEHKEQSNCKRFLPILPAPPNKLGRIKILDLSRSLTRSELFYLYPTGKHEQKMSLNSKLKDKVGFSRSSICFLQVHYKHDNYPSTKEMDLMSKRLGIEREKVEIWFQKQRNRERKGRSVGYKPHHQCRECSSVFVHADALWDHECNVHNPSRISIEFMCPIEKCAAKFPNATLLQTHQLEHTTEEPIRVQLAQTPVGNTLNLTNSVKEGDLKMYSPLLEAYYRENNFPLPLEMGFIAQRLRVDPIGIHWWFKERRGKEGSRFEDDSVASRGKNCQVSTLNADQSTTTKTGAKDCPICTAAFLDNEMLTSHQKTHSTNFSLVCWECGADFSGPVALETHMLQHNYLVPDDIMSASKVLVVNACLDIKYSFVQLQVLYNHFKINNYPKKEEVKLISRRLKVPMKHVQTWFKHQRISELAFSKATLRKGACSRTNSISSGRPTSTSQTPSLDGETGRAEETTGDDTEKTPVFEIVSSRTGCESSCLPCGFCPSEFVSNRLLNRHTALHKSGGTFPCASCSATFLHQMVRDTHSLSHYASTNLNSAVSDSVGSGASASIASSELGLKARSKVLDRETKARLRKLIGKDVDPFFVNAGSAVTHCGNGGGEKTGGDVIDDGNVLMTLKEILTKGTCSSSSSRFHGDEDEVVGLVDCDVDDDDDAKLVIDE